ncbi:hypothetical protein ACFQU7_33365 [Pseudoroseomonas wenyumeiae]
MGLDTHGPAGLPEHSAGQVIAASVLAEQRDVMRTHALVACRQDRQPHAFPLQRRQAAFLEGERPVHRAVGLVQMGQGGRQQAAMRQHIAPRVPQRPHGLADPLHLRRAIIGPGLAHALLAPLTRLACCAAGLSANDCGQPHWPWLPKSSKAGCRQEDHDATP